jgi:hypothetical protein
MHLDTYRIIFIAVGLIGALLFSWPTIGIFIKPQMGEEFSELYILGPNHTINDIPFNIKSGVNNTVYLGIGNHMALPSYYTVYIKFLNETEMLSYSQPGLPISAAPLFEYKALVDVDKNWEAPLTFQVKTLTFANGVSYLTRIMINGIDYSVNKESVWDANRTGYYYCFLVELCMFNSTSGVSQYHNRSVHLILNMTD